MSPAPVSGVCTLAGRRIPAVGLGTWSLKGDDGQRVIGEALELGYRHLDTAPVYGNEAEVGAALEGSGLTPGEVFVSTKLWVDAYEPDPLRESAERSRELIGVEQLDLLYLHWPPQIDGFLEPALETLQELRAEGVVAELGISNFGIAQTREALALAPGIAALQFELHPHLHRRKLLELAAENDLLVQGYAPLGSGHGVLGDPLLTEIAGAHRVTPAQVALAWVTGLGNVAALPRSTNPGRLAANLGAPAAVELSDRDRNRIAELAGATHARHFEPPYSPAHWDD